MWRICLLLLCWPLTTQAAVQFDVQGLSGDPEQNVTLYLKQLPAIKAAQLPRYRADIDQAVRQGLQALGYYQPQINYQKDADTLTIKVNKGPQLHIRRVDIRLTGDAQQDPRFQALLKHPGLAPGKGFRHDDYEASKSRFLRLAAQRGYFDAHFTEAKVAVHVTAQAADVTLHFASGQRYRFGPVTLAGMDVRNSLLAPLIAVQPGEPYQAAAIAKTSQDIAATGYFRSVEVTPQTDHPDGQQIPVTINLTAKAKNQVELGLGVSTDEGPRASVSWHKPMLNSRGHSFSSRLKVSKPRQDATLEYRIPNGDPLRHFYSLQGGYQHVNQLDTRSSKATLALHRWDKPDSNWNRDLFLRLDYDSYTQADQSATSFLVIPGVSFHRTRKRGGTDPYWGDSQWLTLEASDKLLGSDARFVRLWGRSLWLRSLTPKSRLLMRVEQGALWVNSITDLPPSLRFFTGGDQTVRGFAYQSVAPRNDAGELVGGRYTTAASVEYDYQIASRWRLAAFVDSGTATNSYRHADWKVGTGFGVRWLTPIGPVRLDLAFGVSETHVPWRLHFTMGPMF
ncbi:autotransporter assembly complex protein TamA [Gallaecimonas sp. GXIMD1310]|uniref:autotransporter assembly complex protein TamA n=1 Tax=Gallaecimonas sp. GXIMD1310 TaxID=3131926 RepID=UPI00324683D7